MIMNTHKKLGLHSINQKLKPLWSGKETQGPGGLVLGMQM